jgi:hypothetical protein
VRTSNINLSTLSRSFESLSLDFQEPMSSDSNPGELSNFEEKPSVISRTSSVFGKLHNRQLSGSQPLPLTKAFTLEELKRNGRDFLFDEIKLDLSNSDITDGELENIINGFPNIKGINATHCHALTDKCLAHLKFLKNLTSLNLRWCDKITDAGLSDLSKLKNLTSLDLGGCDKITDAGLADLSELRNLMSLDLKWAHKITDAGLADLSNLENLRSLDLSGCKKITDAGLAHLSKLENLRSLDLSKCKEITDAGLALLGRSIKIDHRK